VTIVSYSEVVKWQTCPRQYYYRFILGCAPTEESSAITTGIKGHKLLQYFYELMREGRTKEEALEIIQQKALELQQKSSFSDFSILPAWTLVDNYIRDTDFTHEAKMIENRFLFPVSRLDNSPDLAHVQIGFTPDLVIERKGKRLDIEDAKFVGRAWSAKKLERFPQTKLYQLFMEGMGYQISRTLIRFFNTTTAKMSIYPYVMEPAEKKILTRDFLTGVRAVLAYKEGPKKELALAPRTMNNNNCQGCSFSFPCNLEAKGKSAEKTLASQYIKSDYDYTR